MTCQPEARSEAAPQPDGWTPARPVSPQTVAMIAHELRSPLAVIANVLTVCRESVPSAALPAAGAVLDRQVKRALRLVNDLMDLARLGEEGLHFHGAPVDLASVAMNAAQDLDPEFRARRQTIALELVAEEVWVRGDATQLAQIVGNLLENSGKYSPDGGRIVLTLSCERGQTMLCVRDDGDGISAEDMPHIFEPYYRGGGPAHGCRSGLGLGLTLTQRLVRLHGGTIEAKSRGAGRGSEFTVRLPPAAAPG
jgi:two-component system, sensor histidine kinase